MAPVLSLVDVLVVASVGLACWLLYVRQTVVRVGAKVSQVGNLPVKAHVKSVPRLPDPDPLHDFDLASAQPRNYVYANKTVRWPYYQTMSHQPMHINNWIEVSQDLKWYIEEKTRVIREKGKDVVDSLPENDEACGELLEILIDYLPKRYPTLYERLGDDGIWNKVTDEKLTGLQGKKGIDALVVCARLVEDDFLMARERPDGQIYFTGGLVAFPGFYLLSRKINKSLKTVHNPVPYFNEKMLLSVERTLKRFGPDEPFERTSWEIVDDRDLHWHKIASLPEGGKIDHRMDPGDLFFRVDHQTFRKLPRTKGIIFGVHPIMRRIADFEDSPLVPALLVKLHEDGNPTLMNYKVAPAYQDRLIPYLKAMTASQIERGLITGTEEVSCFRELIKEGEPLPSKYTSLSAPTQSERKIITEDAQ